MERRSFATEINSPRERVWEVLWNKDSYSAWTAAFAEGSTVETDGWKKGSKVLFHDGKGSGMVAFIADNRPNEFMSFQHIGMVNDGVEDTTSDKVKDWAGAMENYTLREQDGKTSLVVDIDLSKEWEEYFIKTWPVALEKVKALAEQGG